MCKNVTSVSVVFVPPLLLFCKKKERKQERERTGRKGEGERNSEEGSKSKRQTSLPSTGLWLSFLWSALGESFHPPGSTQMQKRVYSELTD